MDLPSGERLGKRSNPRCDVSCVNFAFDGKPASDAFSPPTFHIYAVAIATMIMAVSPTATRPRRLDEEAPSTVVLVALLPESVSRLSRFKSARNSAAD